MDYSKEYIKMCNSSEEIKKLGVIRYNDYEGDIFACPSCLEIYKEDNGFYYKWCCDDSRDYVWLPRQDQLQDIYDLSWIVFNAECISKARQIAEYKGSLVGDNISKYCSNELAGIHVVMKENYNKEWNGEEWKGDKDEH